jgi:hypothetical protein
MATKGYPDVYATLAELALLPSAEGPIRRAIDEAVREGARLGNYFKEFRLAFSDRPPLTTDDERLVVGLMVCLAQNSVSSAGSDMKHGVWDHFKGGVYMSTGLGRNAETDALEVEYISLLHGTKHHRRCTMWNEVVEWPDGKYRSRFMYRGVDLAHSDPPSFKVPTPEKTRQLVARTLMGVFTTEGLKRTV